MRSPSGWLILGAIAALASAPRIADAASCIPGFEYAIFADGSVQIQGNADTDSYDSSLGPYGGANVACSGASVGTNTTSSGGVQIQGNSTSVCGNVIIGAGGNTATTIQVTGGSTITGTQSAQTTNTPLPGVTTWPSLPNGSPMSPDFQNVNAVLPANFKYDDVKCKQGSLTLNAGKYVIKTLTLESGCVLIVGSSPIEVYFTDKLQMQGGTVANATHIAGNLMFFGAKNPPQSMNATQVQVQGGASASFAVYAPGADCQVQGNADIYGALVCKSMQLQGNGAVHYDKALASLAGGGFACASNEVSRASPVVALLNNGQPHVVQGSFESPISSQTTITSLASISTFSFPYLKGHMRARLASSIGTSGSSYSSGTILFDAGATGKIPAANYAGCTAFDGSCRQLFTNTNTAATDGTTWRPTVTRLDDTTASTVGALIAPTTVVTGILASHWQTIVRKVLDAKLGGVDRSTVAVIEPSTFAGASTRPTIAYFGASDGMLHAVCASTGGRTASYPSSDICPSLGTEIWAFLPRVQLPLIRTNTARVDGSVRVSDVFGDFTNNPATGTKTWRTILTFQTGFAVGASPAVYAFDITDPASPTLLWEYTKPTSPGAVDLGTGLTIAQASPYVSGQLKNYAVAQTNNGGTGGAGMFAVALSQELGDEVWDFEYAYPASPGPRGVAADLPLPATGIPGGAVGVDVNELGFVTDFVMGDLYGNVWRLNAIDGSSRNGTDTPLFSFSTNKHPIGSPPAIYRSGGTLYAAFASGGYADPLATAWSSTTQYLIAVKIASTASTVSETTTASATGPVGVNMTLTSGDRGFSQAIVIGTQLFVTSDSTDINLAAYGTSTASTGRVYTVDVLTGTSTTTVVKAGASTLANSGSTLYNSSSSKQEQLVASASTVGTGEKIDFESAPKLTRNLWLRSE